MALSGLEEEMEQDDYMLADLMRPVSSHQWDAVVGHYRLQNASQKINISTNETTRNTTEFLDHEPFISLETAQTHMKYISTNGTARNAPDFIAHKPFINLDTVKPRINYNISTNETARNTTEFIAQWPFINIETVQPHINYNISTNETARNTTEFPAQRPFINLETVRPHINYNVSTNETARNRTEFLAHQQFTNLNTVQPHLNYNISNIETVRNTTECISHKSFTGWESGQIELKQNTAYSDFSYFPCSNLNSTTPPQASSLCDSQQQPGPSFFNTTDQGTGQYSEWPTCTTFSQTFSNTPPQRTSNLKDQYDSKNQAGSHTTHTNNFYMSLLDLEEVAEPLENTPLVEECVDELPPNIVECIEDLLREYGPSDVLDETDSCNSTSQAIQGAEYTRGSEAEFTGLELEKVTEEAELIFQQPAENGSVSVINAETPRRLTIQANEELQGSHSRLAHTNDFQRSFNILHYITKNDKLPLIASINLEHDSDERRLLLLADNTDTSSLSSEGTFSPSHPSIGSLTGRAESDSVIEDDDMSGSGGDEDINKKHQEEIARLKKTSNLVSCKKCRDKRKAEFETLKKLEKKLTGENDELKKVSNLLVEANGKCIAFIKKCQIKNCIEIKE